MNHYIYSVHTIAAYLGNQITKCADEEFSVNKVTYGIEVVVGGLFKLLILLTVNSRLGVAPVTMIVVATAGAFRMLTGGAHCTAYYRCLVSSIVIFPALAILSLEISNAGIPISYFAPVTLTAIYSLYRWSPLPPENKPLKNIKEKEKRKYYAVAVYSLFAFFMLIPNTASLWPYAMFTGLTWQTFTLTPPGHKIILALDRMLIIQHKKGGVLE